MSALWELVRFWWAHHKHPGFRGVRGSEPGFFCAIHGEGIAVLGGKAHPRA
jgi:hypothetical protein